MALPNISMRMCSLVMPDQVALSSNLDLNLWKSPLKGSPSMVMCANAW